jgi:hypothetical protein
MRTIARMTALLTIAALPFATGVAAQTSARPAPKQPDYNAQSSASSAQGVRPVQDPKNIALWRASKLIGENVLDAHGKNIGKVEDLMLDSKGNVSFAVMSFGGFLGIGDKLFAVPWNHMRFEHKGNDVTAVVLDVSKETLEKAPSFASDKWPDDPRWVDESRQYWRRTARTDTGHNGTASDGMITTKVKSKLAAEKVSTLMKVNVDTRDGVVQLNGTVDSAQTKDRATELARQVNGVKRVVNNLKVGG